MIGIDKVTLDVATASLDGLWLRQQLISHNVANSKVDGYSAQRLNFEAVMENMARRLDDGNLSAPDIDIAAEAASDLEITEESATVQVDREMADLAMNGIRYQAILTAIGRLGELNRLALTGGTR